MCKVTKQNGLIVNIVNFLRKKILFYWEKFRWGVRFHKYIQMGGTCEKTFRWGYVYKTRFRWGVKPKVAKKLSRIRFPKMFSDGGYVPKNV